SSCVSGGAQNDLPTRSMQAFFEVQAPVANPIAKPVPVVVVPAPPVHNDVPAPAPTAAPDRTAPVAPKQREILLVGTTSFTALAASGALRNTVVVRERGVRIRQVL